MTKCDSAHHRRLNSARLLERFFIKWSNLLNDKTCTFLPSFSPNQISNITPILFSLVYIPFFLGISNGLLVNLKVITVQIIPKVGDTTDVVPADGVNVCSS